MRVLSLFLMLVFQTIPHIGSAETGVEIVAQIADVPAGTKITDSPAALAKIKGVNLLKATPASTASGAHTKIEISQPEIVPGGRTLQLGLTIDLVPVLAENGNITFSGSALDRAFHSRRDDTNLAAVEFATREVFFQGSALNGGTAIIRTSPIESAERTAKVPGRELVIYLTFNKRALQTSKPPVITPVKTKPSQKGTNSTKKTTAKKKAPSR